ncbi:MAG TPA: hypothetical protein VEY50_05920 [Lysobacter sp.]|nr:hypothetical protein [Lysobacter sp.]
MPYRIEFRTCSYLGPRVESPLGVERFDSLMQASAAAKHEAYHLACELGQPIAVLIADDARTLVRHLVHADTASVLAAGCASPLA